MKTVTLFFIGLIVLVTLAGAFSVRAGEQAAAIGAAGFFLLVAALAFYVLVEIRDAVKGTVTYDATTK